MARSSRARIYGIVWGGNLRPGDRSVDVYVSKLRVKLESAMPDHRFIHTHPRFGYRFQPEPSRPAGAVIGTPEPVPGDSQQRPSQDVHISAADA